MSDQTDLAAVLAAPMQDNDAKATTIGGYLRRLLSDLWREEECFSGKSPFGNSSWQYEVYTALATHKFISATFDDEGYLDDFDEQAGAALVQAVISHAFTVPPAEAPAESSVG